MAWAQLCCLERACRLCPAEGNDVICLEPNTNLLIEGMVMVAWHQGENLFAIVELKGVQEVCPSERLTDDLCLKGRTIVVHNIIWAQEHADISHMLAVVTAARL